MATHGPYSAKDYAETYHQPELDQEFTKGRLQGKVAIVTGGNYGIGRAIVERISSDGAIVAIFARNEETGNAVVKETNSRGGKVSFYKVDVADRKRCQEAVKDVADANNGRIDILVNNAAYFDSLGRNFVHLPVGLLEETLSVNVVACAALAQECIPYLKKGGLESSIVNITSISAMNVQPNQSAYNASKAGLLMMSKCMALDLSSSGVRVNCVSPGATWTGITRERGKTEEEFGKARAHTQMGNKVIPSSGIAAAVAFVCSKDAMYINAANINVDLGYDAMGPEGNGMVKKWNCVLMPGS